MQPQQPACPPPAWALAREAQAHAQEAQAQEAQAQAQAQAQAIAPPCVPPWRKPTLAEDLDRVMQRVLDEEAVPMGATK